MAQQNRTSLKAFFQTGKVPTQGQYEDLIDSQLNLAQTDTQIIRGEISSSTINTAFHITASGDISASGTMYSGTGSFNHINSPTDDSIHIESDKDVKIRIDSDNDESGHLRIYEGASANPFFQIKDDGKTVIGGSAIVSSASAMLTVNGDISASNSSTLQIGTASFGTITGSRDIGVNFETPITASKDINCLGTIFGNLGTTSEIAEVGTLTSLNVNGNTLITASIMRVNMSSTHPFQITGSISSSGGFKAGEISGSFISSSKGISTLGDIRAKHLDIFGSASFDHDVRATATIYAPAIGTGTSNNAVVLNSSGFLKTDVIDSKVWDSKLVDYTGTVAANNIAIFNDTDGTLTDDNNLSWSSSTLSIGGNIVTNKIKFSSLAFSSNPTPSLVSGAWSNGASLQVSNKNTFLVRFTNMPAITSKYHNGVGNGEYMRLSSEVIKTNSHILINVQREGSTSAGMRAHPFIVAIQEESCEIYFASSTQSGIPAGETIQCMITVINTEA
tara:strand:+ start:543 stop:2054 length:1512 start_codon:yes stop_codon:yes gene_type:complete